jgi:hypothetical protein
MANLSKIFIYILYLKMECHRNYKPVQQGFCFAAIQDRSVSNQCLEIQCQMPQWDLYNKLCEKHRDYLQLNGNLKLYKPLLLTQSLLFSSIANNTTKSQLQVKLQEIINSITDENISEVLLRIQQSRDTVHQAESLKFLIANNVTKVGEIILYHLSKYDLIANTTRIKILQTLDIFKAEAVERLGDLKTSLDLLITDVHYIKRIRNKLQVEEAHIYEFGSNIGLISTDEGITNSPNEGLKLQLRRLEDKMKVNTEYILRNLVDIFNEFLSELLAKYHTAAVLSDLGLDKNPSKRQTDFLSEARNPTIDVDVKPQPVRSVHFADTPKSRSNGGLGKYHSKRQTDHPSEPRNRKIADNPGNKRSVRFANINESRSDGGLGTYPSKRQTDHQSDPINRKINVKPVNPQFLHFDDLLDVGTPPRKQSSDSSKDKTETKAAGSSNSVVEIKNYLTEMITQRTPEIFKTKLTGSMPEYWSTILQFINNLQYNKFSDLANVWDMVRNEEIRIFFPQGLPDKSQFRKEFQEKYSPIFKGIDNASVITKYSELATFWMFNYIISRLFNITNPLDVWFDKKYLVDMQQQLKNKTIMEIGTFEKDQYLYRLKFIDFQKVFEFVQITEVTLDDYVTQDLDGNTSQVTADKLFTKEDVCQNKQTLLCEQFDNSQTLYRSNE